MSKFIKQNHPHLKPLIAWDRDHLITKTLRSLIGVFEQESRIIVTTDKLYLLKKKCGAGQALLSLDRISNMSVSEVTSELLDAAVIEM